MENVDGFMPLLVVVKVLDRAETFILNSTLRRHLEVLQSSPVSFFLPGNKLR